MRVLLLSAYAAASHVHWQRSLLAMFPHWRWQVLTLPPRHFSWRVRGNPLYWALEERALLECDYDLLVATSMVDLATLRGLVPSLARLPSLLYFHENQFDYPQRSSQHNLLEAQMVSLYSALAADCLAFNSIYNRDTFLAGVAALLRKLPDRVPRGVSTVLADKTRVLPVPIELGDDNENAPHWPGCSGRYPQRPLRLVWSGRFEHDKGGETLWHALAELDRRGFDYELALTGQRFRSTPPVFTRIEEEFKHRLVHVGFLPDVADYRALLRSGDVVLSTAQHEFQGLAVLEAVASGCLPAVPDRQAYPEIFPPQFLYPVSPDNLSREGKAAADRVCELAVSADEGVSHRSDGPQRLAPPNVSAFGLQQLQPHYREVLEQLAQSPG